MVKPKTRHVNAPKKSIKNSAPKKSLKPEITLKKEVQRSFRLPADVNDILTAVKDSKKQHGLTQAAFVVAAIRKYGRKVLGDAVPASPEEVLEARLEYLERYVSQILWEAMGKRKPNMAKSLREHVAETGHSPYSRNFKELDKLRKGEEKSEVDDTDWITAAFAEEFDFPPPKQKKGG